VPVPVAPQAPTGVVAVAGDTTASISWIAPVFLNSGSITGYTASAAPGGRSCSTTGATACTVTGLTDGTTYSITVTVTATTGTAPSAPVSVTPLGGLSISAPSAATLPAAAPGTTTTGHLGTVTVTDNRTLGSASRTATVTGTAFLTGSGTPLQTIPVSRVTYWSGPAGHRDIRERHFHARPAWPGERAEPELAASGLQPDRRHRRQLRVLEPDPVGLGAIRCDRGYLYGDDHALRVLKLAARPAIAARPAPVRRRSG
jgi:Fibronectin type III domain